MIQIKDGNYYLIGPEGSLRIQDDDEITKKICMIYEGECEGHKRTKVAERFGYTRQRYHQILNPTTILMFEI